MNEPLDRSVTRRVFFQVLARCAAMTGLGALTGWLIGRRLSVPESERCINLGVCGRCPILKRCGLPKALASRAKRKAS